MKLFKRWLLRRKLRKLGLLPDEYRLLSFLRNHPASIASIIEYVSSFRSPYTLLITTRQEYSVKLANSLVQRGLACFNSAERVFSISEEGSRLLEETTGPVSVPLIERWGTTDSCSLVTIVANGASALLLLLVGLFTHSLSLAAGGIHILLYTAVFLITWWGIKTGRLKMVAIQLILFQILLCLALLVFAVLGVLPPVDPIRPDWVAALASLATALTMFGLYRYQYRVGRKFVSFSLLSLASDSLRHFFLALALFAAVASSYFGLIATDKVVAAYLALLLFINGLRLWRELRRYYRSQQSIRKAFIHWFEQRVDNNRQRFFLNWLLQLLYEKPLTKSEILAAYKNQFEEKDTSLFEGVWINLSRDRMFERNLNRYLGELMYEGKLHIEKDKYACPTIFPRP